MEPAPARPVIVVLHASDGPPPPALGDIAERAEIRATDASGLAESLSGAHALFLWDYFSAAVREAWDHAGDLQWIHVAAAGVDTLLFRELVESNITVTNARGVFDRPIAEYVLSAILNAAKDTQFSFELQGRREWRHRETRPIRASRALIVGTGSIGREIARLLRAVDVEVVGAGRTAREDPDFGQIVPSADLVDHVGEADHLILVAPLTEATRGMVDHAVLAAMKPGAHLINVGRGPLVDEEALLKSLNSGQLRHATLDVFATEPLPSDHELWAAPGAVITPHMSGDVVGWLDELADQFVANARRWLAGDPLINVVDKERGFVSAPTAVEENQ